jgi:hypothetical protein
MNHELSQEVAAAAAALVVDEGLEYLEAKRRAAQQLLRGAAARNALPTDEQVEDEVRTHLAVYHADTQPAELKALRELALQWALRLAAFRPHVSGAVWRGTATRLSCIRMDLYCDDAKAAEIALINLGVRFDTGALPRHGAEPLSVLSLSVPCPALGESATLHLLVREADEIRGALKPDARGQSWRGDAQALQRRLANAEKTHP